MFTVRINFQFFRGAKSPNPMQKKAVDEAARRHAFQKTFAQDLSDSTAWARAQARRAKAAADISRAAQKAPLRRRSRPSTPRVAGRAVACHPSELMFG